MTTSEVNTTMEQFLAADEKLQQASINLQAARERIATAGRWGECRRFAGKRAGNRLSAVDTALARWSRAYDAAQRKYMTLYGSQED